jgi:hypothetical protein
MIGRLVFTDGEMWRLLLLPESRERMRHLIADFDAGPKSAIAAKPVSGSFPVSRPTGSNGSNGRA